MQSSSFRFKTKLYFNRVTEAKVEQNRVISGIEVGNRTEHGSLPSNEKAGGETEGIHVDPKAQGTTATERPIKQYVSN